jgi:hypothetical protein
MCPKLFIIFTILKTILKVLKYFENMPKNFGYFGNMPKIYWKNVQEFWKFSNCENIDIGFSLVTWPMLPVAFP